MRKKMKSFHKTFLVYALLLLPILIGFLVLYLTVSYGSANHTYSEITCNNSKSVRSSYSVKLSISKEWLDNELHEQIPCGAQYDGIITNNTDEVLKNWKLEIELPEDAVLDSSWNGNYTLENQKIILTPVSYNTYIGPHDSITFGFVLYSGNFLDFKTCSISGFRDASFTNSPLFWLLSIIAFLWLVALTIQIFTYMRTAKYMKRQEKDAEIILQSMNTFAGLIDAKDSYTRGHSTRVAEYSKEIARRMKLDTDEQDTLYYIALMHDCGKVGIPDAILTKPGRLTNEERQQIQSHTTLGGKILENFTAIPDIRNGALYHHERYDGTGYPQGLSGTSIPLYARIICIADSYDAMSSKRCYRNPLCKEDILTELQINAGKQFDPELVQYMIEMINDNFVYQIQKEMAEI